MSRVTRIKHLKREDNSDNFDPPTEQQKIVKILKSNGNNLHEVEDPDTSNNYLVSMPTKFRKSFWIKRGNFVIVELIAEGGKVKAEIVRVLTQEHEKEFTKLGIWPKKFSNKRENENDDSEENTNRLSRENYQESSSEDDSENE